MTTTLPAPTLCRLEYLTASGWVVGHRGTNLLHPGRYVERLTNRGKFGRATVLDDEGNPTETVYVSPDVPEDLSILVPSQTKIPQLPTPGQQEPYCTYCHGRHSGDEGSCLI